MEYPASTCRPLFQRRLVCVAHNFTNREIHAGRGRDWKSSGWNVVGRKVSRKKEKKGKERKKKKKKKKGGERAKRNYE